jgi:hypothetical protein
MRALEKLTTAEELTVPYDLEMSVKRLLMLQKSGRGFAFWPERDVAISQPEPGKLTFRLEAWFSRMHFVNVDGTIIGRSPAESTVQMTAGISHKTHQIYTSLVIIFCIGLALFGDALLGAGVLGLYALSLIFTYLMGVPEALRLVRSALLVDIVPPAPQL